MCEHTWRWRHLRSLKLAAAFLGDEGAVELSVGIVECVHIKVLDICSNAITDTGAGAFAESLPDLRAAGACSFLCVCVCVCACVRACVGVSACVPV